MLVVSGHYRKVEDTVVIELFGRTEEGMSAAVLVRGFDPYFYIVEKNPPVGSEPRIKTEPISNVGGFEGAILCSEKTANTPSGKNLPGFAWDDLAWYIEICSE